MGEFIKSQDGENQGAGNVLVSVCYVDEYLGRKQVQTFYLGFLVSYLC